MSTNNEYTKPVLEGCEIQWQSFLNVGGCGFSSGYTENYTLSFPHKHSFLHSPRLIHRTPGDIEVEGKSFWCLPSEPETFFGWHFIAVL